MLPFLSFFLVFLFGLKNSNRASIAQVLYMLAGFGPGNIEHWMSICNNKMLLLQ